MQDDFPYIHDLIAEGEHQQLDFKFEISDSKKIARSLVAFANTNGGRLLVGVKDNGSIAGVRSEEEFYMVDMAAKMYCKPEINFEWKNRKAGGKQVLEIIVPKSIQQKHKAPDSDGKYKIYIRVDDENILATGVHLKVWEYEQQSKGVTIKLEEPEMKLIRFLNKNDKITFHGFKKLAEIPTFLAVNILAKFITVGLLEIIYQDKEFVFKLFSEDTDLDVLKKKFGDG